LRLAGFTLRRGASALPPANHRAPTLYIAPAFLAFPAWRVQVPRWCEASSGALDPWGPTHQRHRFIDCRSSANQGPVLEEWGVGPPLAHGMTSTLVSKLGHELPGWRRSSQGSFPAISGPLVDQANRPLMTQSGPRPPARPASNTRRLSSAE